MLVKSIVRFMVFVLFMTAMSTTYAQDVPPERGDIITAARRENSEC